MSSTDQVLMNEKVAGKDRWLSVCPFLSFEGLVFVCACDGLSSKGCDCFLSVRVRKREGSERSDLKLMFIYDE